MQFYKLLKWNSEKILFMNEIRFLGRTMIYTNYSVIIN